MKIAKTLFISSLIFSITHNAYACSRVLHVEQNKSILVGRNMDWSGDLQTNLFVYPRGLERNSKDQFNSFNWTAKYGSIAATAYDQITTDGMNEKGLAAHLLYLRGTDYGDRDIKIPGLSVFQWAQYYLDNFQTVNEAVKFTNQNSFQISTSILPASLHLAIEDAMGDSAIIEYIAGKPVIYHDKDFKVLTNEPTYNIQLENVQRYLGLGGDLPLPGSNSPEDRFVRASFYEKYLPQALSVNDEIMNIFSVLQNIAEPFGSKSTGRPEYIPTIWEVVLDLSDKIYYYHDTKRLNTLYVQLEKFHLEPGAAIMKLDLINNPDLAGDVTNQFKAQ